MEVMIDGVKYVPVKPEYYNGKVVCVESSLYFTKGKVYEYIDGKIIGENGFSYTYLAKTKKEALDRTAEFIELVE